MNSFVDYNVSVDKNDNRVYSDEKYQIIFDFVSKLLFLYRSK